MPCFHSYANITPDHDEHFCGGCKHEESGEIEDTGSPCYLCFPLSFCKDKRTITPEQQVCNWEPNNAT